MVEPATVGQDRGASSDAGTALAIRFAVYLTGGLVMLGFGVMEVAESLGFVLECAYQTSSCPSGFVGGIELEFASELGAGAFLVVVAGVLFLLARRSH